MPRFTATICGLLAVHALLAIALAADLQLAGRDVAFAPISAGPRALAHNPSHLGLLPRDGVEALAIDAAMGNDTYSLQQYNRFNGAYWGEEEKEAILDEITGSEIRMGGSGRMTLLGLTLGRFGCALETRVLSHLELPKELVRMALEGNTIGETFDVSDADGGGIAFSELRVSYAGSLDGLARELSLPLRHGHAGFSVKLLRGWGYVEVVQARGGLITTAETIAGEGALETLRASGGTGYGLDLGLSGFVTREWIASLALQDVVGRIRWTRRVERRTDFFAVPEMDLRDIEEDLVQSGTVVTRVPSVTRDLPATLTLGVGRLTPRLGVSAVLDVPLRASPFGKRSVGISMGGGWMIEPWIVLRGFGGLGGTEGTRLGAGVGVFLGPVAVDLSLRTWGTFNAFAPNGMGLSIGFGMESWRRPFREA